MLYLASIHFFCWSHWRFLMLRVSVLQQFGSWLDWHTAIWKQKANTTLPNRTSWTSPGAHLVGAIWRSVPGGPGWPRWLYELWSPFWTVLSVAAWRTLCCKCFHRSTCVFPRTWRRTCWHFFREAYKPTGRRLAVISLLQQEHLIKKQFNSMHLTP